MEWSFGIGDMFHWTPFGTNLRLIDTEQGIGRFVEVNGYPGTIKDGSPIYEWPLDQYVLQSRHIKRIVGRS